MKKEEKKRIPNEREKALQEISDKEKKGEQLSFGETITKIGNAGKPPNKKKK